MIFLVESTAPLRANDTHVEYDNLIGATIQVAQNSFTNNGYRIITYDPGTGQPLRVGSKAVLRTHEAAQETETQYDTLAEAQTAAALLSASDGYDILDLEQPLGSAPTLIIEAWPSLHVIHYGADIDSPSSSGTLVDSRQNGHGRADTDRF